VVVVIVDEKERDDWRWVMADDGNVFSQKIKVSQFIFKNFTIYVVLSLSLSPSELSV